VWRSKSPSFSSRDRTQSQTEKKRVKNQIFNLNGYGSMHYLIDGYNFLFFLCEEESLESSRQQLIENLNIKAKQTSHSFTLVFDAMQQAEPLARQHFDVIEVVYTERGKSADSYIIEEVERSNKPHLILVVSNDNEVVFRAKQLGAKHKSCSSFLSWLKKVAPKAKSRLFAGNPVQADSSSKGPHLVPRSAAEYLKIFEALLKKKRDL